MSKNMACSGVICL